RLCRHRGGACAAARRCRGRPDRPPQPPLLYQVATAILSPAEIAAPIRQLEAKQRNASVLLAEVTAVDVASRTIEAASHSGRPVRRRCRFRDARRARVILALSGFSGI